MIDAGINTKKTIEIITEEGLALRQFVPDHAQELFDLIDLNREHLSQYGDATSVKYPDYDSVLKSITNPENPHKIRLGIFNQEGNLTGTVNLKPMENGIMEVGYWIGSQHGGKGHATNAVKALVRHAFNNLDCHAVLAQIHQDNIPSQRVVTKAGFEYIARDPREELFMIFGIRNLQ